MGTHRDPHVTSYRDPYVGSHVKKSLIPHRVRRDRRQLSEILFCDHDKLVVEPAILKVQPSMHLIMSVYEN